LWPGTTMTTDRPPAPVALTSNEFYAFVRKVERLLGRELNYGEINCARNVYSYEGVPADVVERIEQGVLRHVR